ncbi:MAG: peptidoglycan-binding domain-containing protein [Acidobacteriota bacterium]
MYKKSIIATILFLLVNSTISTAVAGITDEDGEYLLHSVSSPVTITLIQKRLKAYGYYQGPVNGTFSMAVVKALKDFQDDQDLEETGSIDLATTEALGLNFYTVSHDGLRVITYALDSPEMVEFSQMELSKQGLYAGPFNGEMNSQTAEALKQYQLKNNLNPTGQLDHRTAGSLGLIPVEIPLNNE